MSLLLKSKYKTKSLTGFFPGSFSIGSKRQSGDLSSCVENGAMPYVGTNAGVKRSASSYWTFPCGPNGFTFQQFIATGCKGIGPITRDELESMWCSLRYRREYGSLPGCAGVLASSGWVGDSKRTVPLNRVFCRGNAFGIVPPVVKGFPFPITNPIRSFTGLKTDE